MDSGTPKFAPEPLFSFIVPVHKVPKDTLKRCLMSLADQDYPQIEIICVINGSLEDPEIQDAALACARFKDSHENVTIISLSEGNACAARNAGFAASKGEIVSFFNSDYIAKAGMVRLWVDTLQAHPECGFAYGAYEYASQRRSMYPSKPFDPFALRIANYIDCGFPLWRKYVVEWDVNCKSLQDWDFWLRVVAQGVKGHYLEREISFLAEPPRPKGLSEDSHANWIERVRYIKQKNGIPENEICVASLGAPYHGLEIAKMIGADYRDDTIFKPQDYKALYLIGWYMKPSDQGNQHPTIMMAFDRPDKPHTKRILHFVGADIYWLRKFPYESLKSLAGAITLKATSILCETELAQKELADFGIQAEVLPIPSYNTWEVKPAPEEFSVAVFLTNKSDFDKYLFEHTLSIVRAMPDVQFTAYGDGGQDVEYPNLKHYKNLSREEWQKFVYANSAYLRIVRHDTLPMASCEFLMAGRDVISNIPHPFVEYIDTTGNSKLNEWDMFGSGVNAYRWPATKKAIIQRIRAVKNGRAGNRGLEARLEAAEYYEKILDKDAFIAKIRALALEKGEQNGNQQLEAATVASD